MDYVVGSVAALITGNVTPNRPRLVRRALTPTKHQPSPNVTPKSEFVEDRSIFLSPTMQKKKAIVKKSPKRIFQNPDLETTENDGNASVSSPKADKVKKHLKDDLDVDSIVNTSVSITKSPKNKGNNKRESMQDSNTSIADQQVNESTPKKKKKKNNSELEITANDNNQFTNEVSTENSESAAKSPKNNKQRRKSVVDTDIHTDSNKENDEIEKVTESKQSTDNNKSPKKQKGNQEPSTVESNNENKSKKKNKKRKKKSKAQSQETSQNDSSKENISQEQVDDTEITQSDNQIKQIKKKTKKNKNKKSQQVQNKPEAMETDEPNNKNNKRDNNDTENFKSKAKVNPNAITDKESDSEHESDNEIESENEEINKKVLESEKPAESSDDEEEEEVAKPKEKKVEQKEGEGVEKMTEDEIKRTLFVGNVPYTAKCKKEIKKIFNKHGQIETIRIRTVPIKDGRYTPKLALIKNELHPERTTVNVYINYTSADSVEKALSENNTVLNDHHLRVSRSSSTGAEHDPRCSVFVGNLPFAMEDEALRVKFEKCGEIHSVRIIRDKKTNAGKGFGYVNFESKDGVELALALTEEDLTVKNRILRVKRCTQTNNKKKPVPTGNNQSQRSGNQVNQRFGNQSNQRPGNQMNQKGGFRGNQGGFQQRSKGQGDRQRGGFNNNNQRSQGQSEEGRDGAFRRIMHKRKNQEGAGEEPPHKKQKNINQPHKEKKSKKEFVGMTAEKKKKRKFDKGQKKKKALSEILTK